MRSLLAVDRTRTSLRDKLRTADGSNRTPRTTFHEPFVVDCSKCSSNARETAKTHIVDRLRGVQGWRQYDMIATIPFGPVVYQVW
jgi:hypothetical protein